MAKVTFSSLKLKVNEDIKTIEVNDKEIEVKTYLSADEVNNLIASAIQAATESDVFNTWAFDMYFHLYFVMYVTNISFTEKQMEDLPKLYDILSTNGIINSVISKASDLYTELFDIAEEQKEITINYMNSIKRVVDTIESFAPQTAEKINKELNEFDIDKYEQVTKIARATGAQI